MAGRLLHTASIATAVCGLLVPAVSTNTDERSQPQAAAREIHVLSPGVTYNAGLLDLAEAFTKETRIKVTVTSTGMGRIVNEIKTATPPADAIFLPLELMSTLALDGGIKPGTYTPLGRVEVGLAVRAGAPHPDISTVEKLRAALLPAKAVMYSNPATGSMVARIVDTMIAQHSPRCATEADRDDHTIARQLTVLVGASRVCR
jgi:molybdate transport system substrate-binding protein